MHSFKSSEILICKYIICPKDAGKWGTTAVSVSTYHYTSPPKKYCPL